MKNKIKTMVISIEGEASEDVLNLANKKNSEIYLIEKKAYQEIQQFLKS